MSIYSIIIIALLFLFNYFFYKKGYGNKKLFIITSSFLALYIILTIAIYYNNLSKGYEEGILYGNILNSHFCDEYKYFVDSKILYNHLINGDFYKWITNSLPKYQFIDFSGHPSYGNYNIFVIFLTLLKFLGINSTVDFILVKIVFYIPTAKLIYKISKKYLSENLSLSAVIIFSAFPSYILTNTLLMRDNIILCLSLVLINCILNKKFNIKIILPSLIVLLFLRSYLVLVIFTTYIFTYKNSKKLITIKDILYLFIISAIIYVLIDFNFNMQSSNIFFSFYQIRAMQTTFKSFYGSGILGIVTLFIKTFIQIFFVPLYLNFLKSNLIYLIVFSIGNIIGIIISLIWGIKLLLLLTRKLSKKVIYLIKFTCYFTLLNGLIIMSKDGYIIVRTTLMWLPLLIIIILLTNYSPNTKE